MRFVEGSTVGDLPPDEIPDWMDKLSPGLKARMERFLNRAKEIGLRVEPKWKLVWSSPAGDLTLGYVMPSGNFAHEVWTNTLGAPGTNAATAGGVEFVQCTDRYKRKLAKLWGGRVISPNTSYVADADGKRFHIEQLTDQHFDDWIKVIRAFQRDVRNAHKGQA
ncbi:MAG: hypothetical protein F4Y26_19815 [Gammaproteobacteria bacterium]|nr:hypothetical protein [Gammaproteobacteria bacterium]